MPFDTDYGITKSGEVKQIGDQNNLADKLYSLNDNGTINNLVKPITVRDKNILLGLSKPSKLLQGNGKSGSKYKEIPLYYSTTKSKTDALNVFVFMSDNSPIEFGLLGNKKNEWVIGTLRSETIGAMLEKVLGFEFDKLTTHYHSHGENNAKAFKPSSNDFKIAIKILKFNSSADIKVYMPELNMKNWNKSFPNQKIDYNPDKMYRIDPQYY